CVQTARTASRRLRPGQLERHLLDGAVGLLQQLLDLALRRIQAARADARELDSLFEQPERFVQVCLAAFQPAHDLLETGKRLFKAEHLFLAHPVRPPCPSPGLTPSAGWAGRSHSLRPAPCTAVLLLSGAPSAARRAAPATRG